MSDNFSKKIKQAAQNITLSNEAKTQIIANCVIASTDNSNNNSKAAKSDQNRRLIKSAVAATAAVLICFTAALPALASNVPVVYEGLYALSPAAAQYFKPIQRSCTDNGIRMEVISAYIHDDTAEIYIAMTDLEGDRIDSTLDLYDSYHINTAFDSAGHCELVRYDAQSKTAVFLINIQHMRHEPISRSKITFSVSKMLSRKQNLTAELDFIDLSAIPETLETVSNDEAGSTVLQEFEEPVYSPGDGAVVTAYGIIDGRLHVQMRYDNIFRTDNHGWLYLADQAGNIIVNGEAVTFFADDHNSRYYEYIFDISDIKNPDYRLIWEFVLCDTLIEGNWEVTFSLEDALAD